MTVEKRLEILEDAHLARLSASMFESLRKIKPTLKVSLNQCLHYEDELKKAGIAADALSRYSVGNFSKPTLTDEQLRKLPKILRRDDDVIRDFNDYLFDLEKWREYAEIIAANRCGTKLEREISDDENILELNDIIIRSQMLCEGLQYAGSAMNTDTFATAASGAFALLAKALTEAWHLVEKIECKYA